jgi:hypothetical protein
MRYTVTPGNKKLSLALMGIGLLAIVFAFVSDPDRAWANLLVSGFYFMAIALAGTFFVAVHYASRAGWSALILRVPMAMGQFLPFAAAVILLIVVAGMMHGNHIYHWMDHELFDPQSPKYDKIIAGKEGFLNKPFFLIRIILYFVIWYGFTHLFRKESMREDIEGGLEHYHRNVKYSAIFLVLFGITSSTSAWDLIMSVDTHWFSTLFGWYTFMGMFVSGLSMLALLLIYLKSNGYLEAMNENHLHDVAKMMFAFSVFWTYLWFSQFMLIWYANLPEEVVYYQQRWDQYKVLWISNLLVNFLFPLIILVSRDSKRHVGTVIFMGIVLLAGHYIDVFVGVMPGTVGKNWDFNIPEIGTFAFFLGLFLWVVFNALSKAPLVPQKHPMLQESAHHHI